MLDGTAWSGTISVSRGGCVGAAWAESPACDSPVRTSGEKPVCQARLSERRVRLKLLIGPISSYMQDDQDHLTTSTLSSCGHISRICLLIGAAGRVLSLRL